MRPLALLFAFVTVAACSSSSDDNGTSSLPAGTVIDGCERSPTDDDQCKTPEATIPDAWICRPKVPPGTIPGTVERRIGARSCILSGRPTPDGNVWCCTRL